MDRMTDDGLGPEMPGWASRSIDTQTQSETKVLLSQPTGGQSVLPIVKGDDVVSVGAAAVLLKADAVAAFGRNSAATAKEMDLSFGLTDCLGCPWSADAHAV